MRLRSFRTASKYLTSIDPDWADLVARVGDCTHLSKPGREPYEALIRAIAYQQLHAKAADAILGKFMALYGNTDSPTPKLILATESDSLRSCGFSVRKVETIRSIAEGSVNGLVPSGVVADGMPDEKLVSRLVALKGIGRWTVEMLLIYTL